MNPVRNGVESQSNASSSSSDGNDDDSDAETVNEFGFVVKRRVKRGASQSLKDAFYQKRQHRRWVAIIPNFVNFRREHPWRFQRRVRQGIPTELRRMAWALLLDIQDLIRLHPGKYNALRQQPLADNETVAQINRDLPRTFPTHSRFQEVGSGGQVALRNILHAYAIFNPLVGYVQGMAFIVATLLMHLTEEEAFWAFFLIMEHYGLETMFWSGLPGLQEKFYIFSGLFRRYLPELHQHFETNGLEPSFYAPQWFLTLYVYSFPTPVAMAIWDAFLAEGDKILYRVPLALLKLKAPQLRAMDMQELLPAIKTLADDPPPRKLMKTVFRFRFPTDEIEQLSEQYWLENPETRAHIDAEKHRRDGDRHLMPTASAAVLRGWY